MFGTLAAVFIHYKVGKHSLSVYKQSIIQVPVFGQNFLQLHISIRSHCNCFEQMKIPPISQVENEILVNIVAPAQSVAVGKKKIALD